MSVVFLSMKNAFVSTLICFFFFSQHDSSSRMYVHEIGNCLSASGPTKPQNPSVQNHARPEGGGGEGGMEMFSGGKLKIKR